MTDITTIYGASDDLIELDGAIYDEFSAYDETSQLTFDNGAVLTIRYDDDGIWRIENTNRHPSVVLTRCEDREGYTDPDGPIYSDQATITGAASVTHTTRED